MSVTRYIRPIIPLVVLLIMYCTLIYKDELREIIVFSTVIIYISYYFFDLKFFLGSYEDVNVRNLENDEIEFICGVSEGKLFSILIEHTDEHEKIIVHLERGMIYKMLYVPEFFEMQNSIVYISQELSDLKSLIENIEENIFVPSVESYGDSNKFHYFDNNIQHYYILCKTRNE